MELGARHQREAASGQHGLFGSGPNPEPPRPINMPDVPEWTETERLAGEKEVLGFFVTGHPMEKYLPRLANITRHDTSSIEEMEHESPVTLAGILTNLRIRPSKKGDLWASGMLEDMRGSVELLVFPQALQQMQSVLKPDTALLIKGRVRHEENARTKIVVSEAKPLEGAVNGAKPELLIRVNLEKAPDNLTAELDQLFMKFPGSNPVVFELTRPGNFSTRMRSRQPRAVNAEGELLSRLRSLCGEDAVEVRKQA
jgi:DNA polymerase-3 subunit alpha